MSLLIGTLESLALCIMTAQTMRCTALLLNLCRLQAAGM